MSLPGGVYNFGEARKNPDKVRQKYLDAFFGPTPIAVRYNLDNRVFYITVAIKICN